jgi:hypothetical protein
MGDTILGHPIKWDTIRQYLKESADWCFRMGASIHPLTDYATGEKMRAITLMEMEIKRWEMTKNKVDPVTQAIVDGMRELTEDTHPDSLEFAMVDWMVVGLATGYRCIEWAQKHAPKKKDSAWQFDRADDPHKSIYAVCGKDIVFLDKNEVPIQNPHEVNIDQIAAVRVTWRIQKNRENNYKIKFAKMAGNSRWCTVRAWLRIDARATRLGVTPEEPLAVYKRNKGSKSASFIVAAQITRLIRSGAEKAHGVHPNDSGLKFTPHSIRVGACVILHVAGCSAMTIKQRLRWKSDSFMDYLRDVAALASQHAEAIQSTIVDKYH